MLLNNNDPDNLHTKMKTERDGFTLLPSWRKRRFQITLNHHRLQHSDQPNSIFIQTLEILTFRVGSASLTAFAQ